MRRINRATQTRARPQVPLGSPGDALMTRGHRLPGRLTRLRLGPRCLDPVDLYEDFACSCCEPRGGHLPMGMRDEAPDEALVVPQRLA